ncbi:uncharacterized protein LOC113601314 isoform X2 [Acinonyx jubatus]|uniref:Uncharacterized protein LOC113601314 isoform X2 n=1 Tax=Acinonyx jubatus TaxID=32536 RepID=A0ABM3PMQ6_ACIJB|nr:uncharacterized protein LOC113601314 isoform X2 [Acinonyx jubatus]
MVRGVSEFSPRWEGVIKSGGNLALTPRKPEGSHGNQEIPHGAQKAVTATRPVRPRFRHQGSTAQARASPAPQEGRRGSAQAGGGGSAARLSCAVHQPSLGAAGSAVGKSRLDRRRPGVTRRTLGTHVGSRCPVSPMWMWSC